MIKLSASSITILASDGNKYSFDSDDLQTRIIRSCLATGIRDSWIAEDISLSIEYALSQADGDKIYTASEVNSLAVKILEETGYPEVAESFKRENSSTEIEFAVDEKMVGDLVKKHLAINGVELINVVGKITTACRKLSLNTASPALVLELAKLYRSKRISIEDINVAGISKTSNPSPWAVAPEDIFAELDSKTYELIETEVLKISGISRLFPAVKVDFKLVKLVRQLKLDLPLTELTVIPYFGVIAKSIDDILKQAITLFRNSPEHKNIKDIPIYLTSTDMSRFARECLQCEWSDSQNCCRDMIAFLERSIEHDIFKITLK